MHMNRSVFYNCTKGGGNMEKMDFNGLESAYKFTLCLILLKDWFRKSTNAQLLSVFLSSTLGQLSSVYESECKASHL